MCALAVGVSGNASFGVHIDGGTALSENSGAAAAAVADGRVAQSTTARFLRRKPLARGRKSEHPPVHRRSSCSAPVRLSYQTCRDFEDCCQQQQEQQEEDS